VLILSSFEIRKDNKPGHSKRSIESGNPNLGPCHIEILEFAEITWVYGFWFWGAYLRQFHLKTVSSSDESTRRWSDAVVRRA
jgi:hypothetical protein